jgi:hypothetical protein
MKTDVPEARAAVRHSAWTRAEDGSRGGHDVAQMSDKGVAIPAFRDMALFQRSGSLDACMPEPATRHWASSRDLGPARGESPELKRAHRLAGWQIVFSASLF